MYASMYYICALCINPSHLHISPIAFNYDGPKHLVKILALQTMSLWILIRNSTKVLEHILADMYKRVAEPDITIFSSSVSV